MSWKVLQIQEADYGCEERQPDEKTKVIVTLQNESGGQKELTVEDEWLYEHGIDEGSTWPDVSGDWKPLRGDWTKLTCKDIDIPAFVNRIERMQKGETTVCPFCGGNVSLHETDGEYSLIACDSCDMKIETETRSR